MSTATIMMSQSQRHADSSTSKLRRTAENILKQSQQSKSKLENALVNLSQTRTILKQEQEQKLKLGDVLAQTKAELHASMEREKQVSFAVQAVKTQIESMREDHRKQTAVLERGREDRDRIKSFMEERAKTLIELQSKTEDQQKSLLEVTERAEKAENEAKSLQEVLDELRAEHKSIIESRDASISALQADLSAVNKLHTQDLDSIEALKKKVSEHESKVTELKDIASLNAEAAAKDHDEMAELRRELENQISVNAAITATSETLRREKISVEEQIDGMFKNNESLHDSREAISNEKDRLQRAYTESESTRAELQASLDEVNARLQSVESELDEKTRACDDFTANKDELDVMRISLVDQRKTITALESKNREQEDKIKELSMQRVTQVVEETVKSTPVHHVSKQSAKTNTARVADIAQNVISFGEMAAHSTKESPKQRQRKPSHKRSKPQRTPKTAPARAPVKTPVRAPAKRKHGTETQRKRKRVKTPQLSQMMLFDEDPFEFHGSSGQQ